MEGDKGTVKKVEKGDMITIEDSKGAKKMIHGSIEGFTIKKPRRRRLETSSVIIGLDSDWEGKRVLCILLE